MGARSKVIGTAAWHSIPGVLDLQESGRFENLRSAQSQVGAEAGIHLLASLHYAALSSSFRETSSTFELSGDIYQRVGLEGERLAPLIQPSSWWRDLLNLLKGYSKDEVVVDHRPTWVPLVTVQVPPGGTAKVVFAQSAEKQGSGEFKIIGSGLGTAGSFSIEDKLTIPAEVTGKTLSVQLVVTLTRYVSDDGYAPFYRLDVSAPQSGVTMRIEDLPPAAARRSHSRFNARAWNILREVDLSHGSNPNPVAIEYSRSGEASWEVDLGVSLSQPVKIDLTAKASFTYSEEWTTTYELPFGHNYVLYGRPNEVPLVPLVARL